MAQKDFSELISSLQTLKQKLLSALPDITASYAETTTSLVIQDIQKNGIPGAVYSTKPMYAEPSVFNRKSGFHPQGKNEETPLQTSVFDVGTQKKKKVAIKKDYTQRKTMYLDDGYKELRELNGLQTAVVDATFSGRLMQNIRTQSVSIDAAKCTAIVGASQQENKDKLSGLAGKYGPFLNPSENVLKISNRNPIASINKIIRESLNISQ